MGTLSCRECGKQVVRRGPGQLYCDTCSHLHDLARKRRWSRRNPPSQPARREATARALVRKELAKQAGVATNSAAAQCITWFDSDVPDLKWLGRVSVPFTYATSKNHIYTLRQAGHVALRKEARQIRWLIAAALRRLTAGQKIARNKLWVDILVQKPDHRGDAVNVIDLVCDAIKDAIDLDDRWYCIRKLDWEIVKHDPRLIVGIGQDTELDCQICSYCGQIKPLTEFGKRRKSKTGVGRECFACRRAGRLLAKSKVANDDGGQ